MFSFGRLLFLRFLLLTLSMCLLAEKNVTQKLLYPKILCPANKYLLKVSDRSPKARGEICEKLTVEIALLY